MSSRPVVLFSAALLALAQLTNSALFDEEGNAFRDVKSLKSLNGQNGNRSNHIVLCGVVAIEVPAWRCLRGGTGCCSATSPGPLVQHRDPGCYKVLQLLLAAHWKGTGLASATSNFCLGASCLAPDWKTGIFDFYCFDRFEGDL